MIPDETTLANVESLPEQSCQGLGLSRFFRATYSLYGVLFVLVILAHERCGWCIST